MIANKIDYRLAIVVSHPIQYYSPLFKELAKVLTIKVFYCFNPSAEQQGKDGFGIPFSWDVDLLNGYDFEFLNNISKNPSSAFSSGCDTPDVGKALYSFNATHVVTFGWHLKSFAQVLKYCKSRSIPIAVRGDSQIDPDQHWVKQMIKKMYYPFFLNKYDAFLSVGARNKAYLKSFHIPDHKILFSPHAVDQGFWKVNKKEHEGFNFLWVAKFTGKKRPLDCIDAFKKALISNPSIKLNMVGTGSLMDEAIEAAKKIDQISFLGFKNQTELKKIYSESDCLVLTSDYGETWGLVVNEAFAASVPAIVSSACGCGPDLIEQNTGLVYTMGDTDHLSNSMLDMVKRKDDRIIFNSIKDKMAIYSYESIVGSFIKFVLKF